jgi:flagellar biosynthesis/type III secretory pathway protein FliH
MLAEKNADVKRAVTIIRRLSGSERERRLADMEELARMDEVVNRRTAYNEGKAEGIAEGKAEGRAEGITEGKAEGIVELEKAKAEGKAELEKTKADGKAELEKTKNDFAKNLLGLNVPVDTIVKATGLSRKEIEHLR